MRYFISGANRGIGLEFVRQLAARGDSIEAGARDPGRAKELVALQKQHAALIHVHRCDVADDSSVSQLGRALEGTAIDVVINNAGIMGSEAPLQRLEPSRILETLNVNAVGPVRISRALLPSVRAGKGRKVIHITSGLGSITENASGGYIDYRMSKAALNMFAKTLAEELSREGIVSVALHPGWVQTDMGGQGAPTPVDASVRGMLRVIDRLTLEDSGKFLGWEGDEVPW